MARKASSKSADSTAGLGCEANRWLVADKCPDVPELELALAV